jgi:hypothetical protein
LATLVDARAKNDAWAAGPRSRYTPCTAAKHAR